MLNDDGSLSILGWLAAMWLACGVLVFLGMLWLRATVGDDKLNGGLVQSLDDLACEVTAFLIIYGAVPALGVVSLTAIVWTCVQAMREPPLRLPAAHNST